MVPKFGGESSQALVEEIRALRFTLNRLSEGVIIADKAGQFQPRYAANGVAYCWLVDPIARTLEAFRLKDNQWLLQA